MKTYKNLWKTLCTYENLSLSYETARQGKATNPKIAAFDKNPRLYLCQLLHELRTKTYKPKPLNRFVLRDPKTRVISVSDFRDRVVHHALVNVLQPVFEPRFIADSYASRKGKSTLVALKRFDTFKRAVARNNPEARVFVLKCDIKHYFETVDHEILIGIIRKRINDPDIEWLIRSIMENHDSDVVGKGMPLGNWTSQFFANVYLNELDQFVKHELRIKHYIRYVDDFVILDTSPVVLENYRIAIDAFLRERLSLELHPNKCKIIKLRSGVSFLGFRVFYHHKLLRKKNERKAWNRIKERLFEHSMGAVDEHAVFASYAGWSGYALHGNTYRLRKRLKEHILCSVKHGL